MSEAKPMTVADLVDFLKTQPQDLLVAYRMHSEQCLLESQNIVIAEDSEYRPDGWIHDARPDKGTRQYLMLPGN